MTKQAVTFRNYGTLKEEAKKAQVNQIEKGIDDAILEIWKEKVDLLESKLRAKESQLQFMIQELGTLEEEMTYLEEKVKVQSRYLMEQNRQLIEAEYSYPNQLKSSISDSMGLVHLIYECNQCDEVQQLTNLLEKNTRQLEDLVKKLPKSSL